VTARRGNPNWGKAVVPSSPATPSEFELEAKRLRLRPEQYVSSGELRAWCKRNSSRCYIPEWLLEAWEIDVDSHLA